MALIFQCFSGQRDNVQCVGLTPPIALDGAVDQVRDPYPSRRHPANQDFQLLLVQEVRQALRIEIRVSNLMLWELVFQDLVAMCAIFVEKVLVLRYRQSFVIPEFCPFQQWLFATVAL